MSEKDSESEKKEREGDRQKKREKRPETIWRYFNRGLVRGHPPSRHLFLMYPDPAGEIRARGYRRMPQYLPEDQPRLGLVPLRWPSRSDLADPAAYREVLRDQFARSIASMA